MAGCLQESDERLLARMRAGDETAFVTLYRRRQGAIFRFALQMSGSETVAEDVTQDVFLALIRGGLGFDPARGSLASYLYGAARNLVRRHFGRSRGVVSIDQESDDAETILPPSACDTLADITRRQSTEAVRQAVLALPERYREALVLCDLEELDYQSAAVALGCAVGTVRSRLHRGRALLVEKLSRNGAGDAALEGLKPVRCLI
jgi:RNA polymerase sigma-70 factor, ECF subfamily